MTTYQDPPLQSRRAVRQGERVDPQFPPPQTPRTAAGVGEPLSYVTQNRPPLPGYDGTPARGRRSVTPEPQDASEPQGFSEPQDAGERQDVSDPPPPAAFRPRDFSPEARTAPPAWAPENDLDDLGVLDHHTQVRSPVSPQAGPSLAAALGGEPNEQTLTRRELRALRDVRGFAAPTGETPVVEQPNEHDAAPAASQLSVPPSPVESTELDSAIEEFDSLADRTAGAETPIARRAGRRAATQVDVAPEGDIPASDRVPAESLPELVVPEQAAPELVVPEQVVPELVVPEQAAPDREAPQRFETVIAVPAPEPVASEQAVPEQAVPEHVVPRPESSSPGWSTVVPPQQPAWQPPAPAAPTQVQASAFAEPIVSPTTGERPIGHWTNQSDIDDRVQISESTISRRVGSGAITTSALVLPSIPGHDPSTGDVMLTDSISLPSGLTATGAHAPIDESDLDHLLDPGDQQQVNTDSVPIRAIRAVSSHTGSQPLIAPNKPTRGNRALTALIVSASGMVVVVVTLLVVALATEVI